MTGIDIQVPYVNLQLAQYLMRDTKEFCYDGKGKTLFDAHYAFKYISSRYADLKPKQTLFKF